MIVARWSHARSGQRLDGGLPRPMVLNDTCEAFVSQADGRTYESKRAYRADLKARGYVETEGCNLPSRPPAEPALTETAIAEAWDQCEAGKGARLADGPPVEWEGAVDG